MPSTDIGDLSPDQAEAFETVARWFRSRPWELNPGQRVFTLSGLAGTGKSFLLARILEHVARERGKAVAVLTPTGKAAVVVAQKLGPLAALPVFLGTIHGFMLIPVVDPNERLVGWTRRYFEKAGEGESATFVPKNGDKRKMPRLDLIIVDESSMLNRDMEMDIEAFGLPVLAVGDHGQLPPVHGRSTWMQRSDVCLERIHRQAEDNPIIALASFVRETGNLPANKDVLRDLGIPYFTSLKEAAGSVIAAHEARGIENVALITYTNAVRTQLNLDIHKHRHGCAEPVQGSQVICLKNNKDEGLTNGMRGIVTSDLRAHGEKGHLYHGDIRFEGGETFSGTFLRGQFGRAGVFKDREEAAKELQVRVPSMKDLGALFDFGYVLTCHKAQGASWSDVFVVLQSQRPKEYARWLYTAITRASERLSFIETWG